MTTMIGRSAAAFSLCALLSAPALAKPPVLQGPKVGEPAPDFTLPDLSGKQVRLADFKGKRVVLEWFNPDCPFVKYAHGGSGPLKGMAARHAKAGVVWLAVNSGAPGKQGAGLARNQAAAKDYGMSHPVLLDSDGAVGKKYGATNTPHMFVINEKGVLVYRGALDNAPMGEPDGTLVNYVDQALSDLQAGKAVRTADTKAYGCGVKY